VITQTGLLCRVITQTGLLCRVITQTGLLCRVITRTGFCRVITQTGLLCYITLPFKILVTIGHFIRIADNFGGFPTELSYKKGTDSLIY